MNNDAVPFVARRYLRKCSHGERKMKNKKFLWGILVIVLAFGMAVVGCDNGSGNGGGDIPVDFESLQAYGPESTRLLWIRFSREISGLSSDNITLSGVPGVIKGTLEFNGDAYNHIYELPISGFTTGGTLTVGVAKSGYAISGSPKSVQINYNGNNGSGDNNGSTALAEELQRLQTNAQSNNTYTIDVSANESMSPQTLSYANRSGITIILRGSGSERIISLSSNGSLFTVESGVTLVLDNNITLKGRSNNNASLVRVNSGGVLETKTGAKITGNTTAVASTSTLRSYGGGVYVSSAGIFTMNGGEISGNTASTASSSSTSTSYGGGVYVSPSGTFTMNGGEIFGNTAYSYNTYAYGGGVAVEGTFTMDGGEISGNTASFSYSTGVYVDNRGSFTMSNGIISGNTISNDEFGSVVAVFNGTFTMDGGEISDNTGSGVVVLNSNGTFTMDGGKISGNTGRGVGVGSGTFTMNNGEISGNNDGGVSVSTTFTMNGGKICGNTISAANGYTAQGGGVGVGSRGTFTMYGGEISDNTAYASSSDSRSKGGGVFVHWGCTFTMYGGSITGNTATATYYAYGGGVYLESGGGNQGGTFNMHGGVISGNTASAAYYAYGGGVSANTGSIFRIVTGTIYGSDEGNLSNTVTVSSDSNTESVGAALHAFYGTFQRGTFNGVTWNEKGILSSTDSTLRVVNGELQLPPVQ
jgi:hypothetical protein